MLTIVLLLNTCTAMVLYGQDLRSETHPLESKAIGGPHGRPFSEIGFINRPDHLRIAGISLTGCGSGEHVASLEIAWRDNSLGKDSTLTTTSLHGHKKVPSVTRSLDFELDEYITRLAFRTFAAQTGSVRVTYHTRIGRMEVWTNKQQYLSCGDFLESDPSHELGPKDMALLYFSGRAGDIVDEISAHWISKTHF